jgi:hypothetical protein
MHRRWSRRGLAGIVSTVVAMSIVAAAWAYAGPGLKSHFMGDIVSCKTIGYSVEGVYVDAGATGLYNTDHNGNPAGFAVQVTNHPGNPMTFDYVSGSPLGEVIVKVGNGGTIYHYGPPVSADSGVESRDSGDGAKTTIGHLVFCPTAGPSAVKMLSFSAKASRAGVHVSWKTASEAGTVGFNVYRQVGTVKVKLNAKLIAAKGGLGGASYSLVDRSGKSSTRYLLQEIQKNGASKLVARATAAS